MLEHPEHGGGQGGTVGIENREMVKPGRPLGRARGAAACPGVEPDVMMVAAGRHENGVGAIAGRDFEAQDIAVELQSAIQVAHGQVNVADSGARIDRHVISTTS